MAASIDDVARAAEVSTATVSRALRNLPHVSTETRERVQRIAAQMGYTPTPSAASLASGRTRTIGLLTPWINRWFFANVIEGAERYLRANGFDLLLYAFDIHRDAPRRRVDPGVLRRRVDGILVVGLPLEEDEVAALRDLGYPLVFVSAPAYGEVSVRIDDVVTARRATEHLLRLGHTVIGHITGSPDTISGWRPPRYRMAGWQQALTDAGLEASEELVVDGYIDRQAGAASTRALLERVPGVTAVFAATDDLAFGALMAARELGLRVPEDLSVVGVDGHDAGEIVGLTTMAQPAVQQGAAAAALVLDQIAGRAVPREVVYPARLIERGSTGPRLSRLTMPITDPADAP